MKVSYLVSYKPEENKSTVVVLDLVEELKTVGDLLKEAVKSIKVYTDKYTLADVKADRKLNYKSLVIENTGKMETNGNGSKAASPVMKFEIESDTTKDLLKTNALTVVAICENIIGERIGLICSDIKGKLYKLDIDTVKSMLEKHGGFLNNAFLKKGGLQFYKGNYEYKKTKDGELAIPLIPTIKIGKALKVDKKVEDTKTQSVNLGNLHKLREPVKAICNAGFIEDVKKYKLYSDSIPDETLWFYYSMYKNGKGAYVPKMITTKNFDELQLNEIALGIMEGVDTSFYADPSVDATEMRRIRTEAKKGIFSVAVPKRLKDLQIELNKKGWDKASSAKVDAVRVALNQNKKK